MQKSYGLVISLLKINSIAMAAKMCNNIYYNVNNKKITFNLTVHINRSVK